MVRYTSAVGSRITQIGKNETLPTSADPANKGYCELISQGPVELKNAKVDLGD